MSDFVTNSGDRWVVLAQNIDFCFYSIVVTENQSLFENGTVNCFWITGVVVLLVTAGMVEQGNKQ